MITSLKSLKYPAFFGIPNYAITFDLIKIETSNLDKNVHLDNRNNKGCKFDVSITTIEVKPLKFKIYNFFQQGR